MNNIIKYSFVKPTDKVGLGSCAYHWNNRDEYRSDAEEYKRSAENKARDIENFKNGSQQLEYENLRNNFNQLLNERDLKERKLKQLKIKTLAWQKEPALHYESYKTNGLSDIGMGYWFGDDLIGCQAGKDAEREWQRKRLKEKEKLDRLVQEYDDLLRNHKVNKLRLEKQIESLRVDIKDLDIAIISELQKQRDIMIGYETKKRAEELGTDQEAEDRKAKMIEEERLKKENKAKERKKLIIGLSIITAFGLVALKKKKNKKQ